MSAHPRIAEPILSAEAWDERLMAAALSIGRRNLGQTYPNPSVGALIVRFEGGHPVVISRGWTARGGRPHAETEALRIAGEAARGATTYVTLEPCAHHGRTPPCANAIVNAGIARAVVAVEDPNPEVKGQGIELLRAAGIEVTLGIGAEEARVAHSGHFRRMAEGRPHVILKLAISADGKTGLAGRRPAEISCPESRAEAHMLRATSDAVLVGIGTVLADDPMLNCRLPGMADRSPIRVVLDARLRMPPECNLARTAREIPLWVISTKAGSAEAERKLHAVGAEVTRMPSGAGGRVELAGALRFLGERGITRLLVEGGPILSAALLQLDLVDEAVVVQSPNSLGPEAVDALEGMPLSTLLDTPKLKVIERRLAGTDTLTHLLRGG
jgi:diaminohydroxyphosphoribosylaminopyrimidine deaminase/5-amino-6-(5-phosphoribosylamino)uracil reductase